MADRNRRREWQGPDFSITSFEVTEPAKQNGGWEIIVVATVAYRRRGVPQQPQTVLVEVDGMTEAEEMTDPEGRIAAALMLKEPGSYLVVVQIKSMPASRLCRRVLIKEEKPKPAVVKDILIQHSGKPGDYEIAGQVVVEGEGVAGKRKVRISEIRGLEAEDIKDTDENGCFKFSAKFGELERTYIVTDIGSGKSGRVRLFGSPNQNRR